MEMPRNAQADRSGMARPGTHLGIFEHTVLVLRSSGPVAERSDATGRPDRKRTSRGPLALERYSLPMVGGPYLCVQPRSGRDLDGKNRRAHDRREPALW